VSDVKFCREVEAMLVADFAKSTPLTESDLSGRSFAFRLKMRLTRLLSPIL
jgi:hypothetical protein